MTGPFGDRTIWGKNVHLRDLVDPDAEPPAADWRNARLWDRERFVPVKAKRRDLWLILAAASPLIALLVALWLSLDA